MVSVTPASAAGQMDPPAEQYVFDRCPLCEFSSVSRQLRSMAKDMSVEGFSYVKCGDCGTYYLRDVTHSTLEAFYRSLPPYESSSSKDVIVGELAEALQLKGTERILDLGCGSGAWAVPLLRHCARLVCVDLDDQAVSRLRSRVADADRSRVEYHVAPSMKFLRGAKPHSFDLVCCMYSFEHDVSPQRILVEIHRVLAPRGRALVLAPSGDALQLAVLGAGFYWLQAPWHTFIPSKKGLSRLAAKAGFARTGTVRPKSPYYSWFWLRGLMDRCGLRKEYDTLRSFPAFVRADIGMDKALDRFSVALGRPSSEFFMLEK